jgi:hypothetical protein
VGVLCGKPSGGLVVLDFDSPDAVRDVLLMRVEELSVHTLVARTARGYHVYALAPGHAHGHVQGVLVRSDGGMVAAPPSIHPSGVVYEFVNANAPLASLASLGFGGEPEPTAASDEPRVDVRWDLIEEWVSAQAPKLRASWALLRKPEGTFDRSRADFAVSKCLWEGGFAREEIVAALLALPGSKARERGLEYARRTVDRAGGGRQ